MIFSPSTISELLSPKVPYNEALLKTILNSSLDAIICINHESVVLEWNSSAEKMFGFTREEAIGQDISRLIIPVNYRAQHRFGMKRWLTSRHSEILNRRVEINGETKEGRIFPVELAIVPLDTKIGPIFTATIRDLTDVKKERDRVELIQKEQKHRIKNIMSVVQSLAQQSFNKDIADVAPFLSRIIAMSKAYDILFNNDYVSANLKDLVASIIYPFERDNNFKISGIPYEIPSNAATSFALVIHELCTNAAKYGALSVPEGCVSISWFRFQEKLVWIWEESKGPPVVENRKGFGYNLITRAFRGQGDTSVEFKPDGLKCVLSLELDYTVGG